MIDVSNLLIRSSIDARYRNMSSSGRISFRIETISIAVKELKKVIYSFSVILYILNCLNNVISLDYSN